MTLRCLLFLAAAVLLAAAPSAAQSDAAKRERVFIAINGAMQTAAPKLSDGFTYEVNAEPAQVDVDYAGKSAPLFDATFGLRLFRSGGVAVGFSRASTTGSAHVEADIPHPFFDDRDRHVTGDAEDLRRSETAVHAQFYIVNERGRMKTRLMGGATYFRVEQDIVTAVNVDETFPFDTATFASADTTRADGTAFGFNVGADVSWMLNRRFGLGALVRYTRGSVDLNAGEGRTVSLDAGGLQAGGGIRFTF